jgi:DNA-binding transcriptional ArsR family regulator
MSFAIQLRQAVEASPRVELPRLSAALWKAFAGGHVGEDEAQALSDLIEARKALPATQKPAQRRVGSRPRSAASMERRRSWAACGHLPPALACRFTVAENAVLAVIAAEVRTKGSCSLTIGHIAALAGVSKQTVRNALREASELGLVRVEERRLTAWRNAPNRVTITSPEWHAWLRMRRRGVGQNPLSPRIQEGKKGAPLARRAANKGGFKRRWHEPSNRQCPKD